MVKSTSNQLIVLVAFVAPFVLVILGCWIWNLQVQLALAQRDVVALREKSRLQVACAPVHVTCECPDYDEGWDDAQFVEGCDPDLGETPIEDLRVMCFELETFGYLPEC